MTPATAIVIYGLICIGAGVLAGYMWGKGLVGTVIKVYAIAYAHSTYAAQYNNIIRKTFYISIDKRILLIYYG